MNRRINIRFTQLSQRGFSLVEIMVAMTIGLVLLLIVGQIFISSKQTYRLQSSLARIQENGRFSLDFLTRDIRTTGYTGCFYGHLANAENNLNDPTNYGWDISRALEGYEAAAGLPVALSGSVIPDTDVVTVRFVSPDSVGLVAPFSNSAQLFVALTADRFNPGEILMVTDCVQASIFQLTNETVAGSKINLVHSGSGAFTPGNVSSTLARSYGGDAIVARFRTHSYFVGTNPDGIPALFRNELEVQGGNSAQLNSRELIEGVENMQILFGEDTDGDNSVNRYVIATDVGDMKKVVSLRVAVLIRSEQNVKSQNDSTTTYDLLGTVVGPFNDRRLRAVYTSNITLRNRVL